MKWTFAVAVVSGFVLAMALAFGGRAMNGPNLVKDDDDCICCGGEPLPWAKRNHAPGTSPAVVVQRTEGDTAN
jgi:hypothetical protein